MAIAKISFRILRMKGRKQCPIVCKVSMGYSEQIEGGKRYRPIEFTTGLSISPDEWDTEEGRACTRANKARRLRACSDHYYINSTLEQIYNRCRLITEEIRGMEFDGVQVSREQARERVINDSTIHRLRGVQIRSASDMDVLGWLSSKNDADTTTEGTKTSRRNTIKHLRAYHDSIYPDVPMQWEMMTREYLEEFQAWLTTSGMKPATVNKQMKTVHTFLGWGQTAGKATSPVKLPKVKEQENTKVYLTAEDIDALCALELTDGERDTRDWFVISCGTGIRVGDLQELTSENLIPVQGKGWSYEITHRQEKTGKAVSVPIVVPQSVAVLERLGWLFPQIRSAQYMNRTIKELAQRAKLNAPTEELTEDGKPVPKWKAITMHTARRSFATNAYKAGVPLEVIRAMTGHSDLRTLEIYLRQSSEEKKQTFANTYTQQ